MHGPFVPFNILFTRAVQYSDNADLALLEGFAASLRPEMDHPESATHPYQLYELLCKSARLYFRLNMSSLPSNLTGTDNMSRSSIDFDLAHFMTEAGVRGDDPFLTESSSKDGLGDWYYSNQQIMSLFDEDLAL